MIIQYKVKTEILNILTIAQMSLTSSYLAFSLFCGICVAESLVFCVVFCTFVLFLLAILLSVFLRFTVSDYPLIFSYFSYCSLILRFQSMLPLFSCYF